MNDTNGKPPIWVDNSGRELQAADFWEMAKYCNDMTQELLKLFVSFQERFQAAALAFVEMAKILETAQKSEGDAKVKNVFDHPSSGHMTTETN